jgi:hypothetical protein
MSAGAVNLFSDERRAILRRLFVSSNCYSAERPTAASASKARQDESQSKAEPNDTTRHRHVTARRKRRFSKGSWRFRLFVPPIRNLQPSSALTRGSRISGMSKRKVLVHPISAAHQEGVNVTFPCSSCDDGSVVVHLTFQYQQMKTRPMDYQCLKCVPDRSAKAS